MALGCGGDGIQHRLLALQRRETAVNRDRLEDGHAEVVVGVDEAWDQGTSGELYDPGIRAGHLGDLGRCADCRELPVAHGNRLCTAHRGVHCEHPTPEHDQVHELAPREMCCGVYLACLEASNEARLTLRGLWNRNCPRRFGFAQGDTGRTSVRVKRDAGRGDTRHGDDGAEDGSTSHLAPVFRGRERLVKGDALCVLDHYVHCAVLP